MVTPSQDAVTTLTALLESTAFGTHASSAAGEGTGLPHAGARNSIGEANNSQGTAASAAAPTMTQSDWLALTSVFPKMSATLALQSAVDTSRVSIGNHGYKVSSSELRGGCSRERCLWLSNERMARPSNQPAVHSSHHIVILFVLPLSPHHSEQPANLVALHKTPLIQHNPALMLTTRTHSLPPCTRVTPRHPHRAGHGALHVEFLWHTEGAFG
jgi:hypothetical protein